jgi:hypothetical protein
MYGIHNKACPQYLEWQMSTRTLSHTSKEERDTSWHAQEQPTSWRVFGVSIVGAALCGFVLRSFGADQRTAEVCALGLGLLLLLFWPSARRIGTSISERVGDYGLTSVLRQVLPIPAVAVFLLCFTSVFPKVEAKVVNARLEHALAIADPAVRSSKSHSVLRLAAKQGIRLQPQLVATALNQNAANPAGWDTYLAAVDYEVASRSFGQPVPTTKGRFDLGFAGSYTDTLIDGATVVYHGGPIKLVRVRFTNCDFRVADTENGKRFLRAVLDSPDSVSIDLE